MRKLKIVQRGQALLVSVLLITFTAVSLGISLAVSSSSEINSRLNLQEKSRSYHLSESGVEDALLQLVRDPNFNTSYNLPTQSSSDIIQVTVQKDVPVSGQTTILSQGSASGRYTKLKVEVLRQNSTITVLTYSEVD